MISWAERAPAKSRASFISRRRTNLKALELAAQDLLTIALLVAWELPPLLIGLLAVRLLRQRYLGLGEYR